MSEEEAIGHERSPVVISNPKGFADTLATDHNRADYKTHEKNSITYNGEKDKLEIWFESSNSLKALYDWLEEGIEAYKQMDMSDAEIEAYEHAVDVVYMQIKYEGETCRAEKCTEFVQNEAMLQAEDGTGLKIALCHDHTKTLEKTIQAREAGL